MKLSRCFAVPFVLFALHCGAAFSQVYPSKPIQMIVPFPPGGVADLTGRPTALAMERIFRQPVVLVNRAGAGGAVGNAAVAKSPPDGYTILMALSSISVIPEAERMCGRAAPYELSQFAPIALISADPTVLAVRSESPYRSAADILDVARKTPGRLTFSSSGIYGALHMPFAMLEGATGVKFLHVPYSGGGPAMNALLGSQVEMTSGGPSTLSAQVKGGKLRVLASWGTKRLESLPDVPTFKELGMDMEYFIWSGVFVPVATPAPIISTLRDAVRRAVQDPEFKATMEKIQTPIVYLDAPDFGKYWEADTRRLASALKGLGCIEDKSK